MNESADDRLSRVMSALLRIAEDEAAGHDDLRLFGAPSECGLDIHRHAERRAEEAVAAHGFTVEELVYAVAKTTTPKVMYECYAHLFSILPESEVWAGYEKAWEEEN